MCLSTLWKNGILILWSEQDQYTKEVQCADVFIVSIYWREPPEQRSTSAFPQRLMYSSSESELKALGSSLIQPVQEKPVTSAPRHFPGIKDLPEI